MGEFGSHGTEVGVRLAASSVTSVMFATSAMTVAKGAARGVRPFRVVGQARLCAAPG